MRKTYIDNIKRITVVLVVIYHVLYLFNGVLEYGGLGTYGKVQYQDIFMYLVYPWFMLLLFVVSGMNARTYLEHHSGKEFLKSRTRKFLVPSTLGLIVFWWILGFYNMKIAGAFESMGQVPKPALFLIMAVSGIGPLWYIQVLWVFSLVLLVFRKVEKDRLWSLGAKANAVFLIALTLLIFGAAQVLNTPVITVYRFGIYGAGFFIGYLLLSHDEVMDRLEMYWLPLTIAGIILAIVFAVKNFGADYTGKAVLQSPLCCIFAWIATLGVLSFMKHWGDFSNSFTEFMVKESWGLYLFHYLGLAASGWYLTQYTKLPMPVIYLLVGISAFVGAYLMYKVVSRIPVLRWCACGIGGKKDVRK